MHRGDMKADRTLKFQLIRTIRLTASEFSRSATMGIDLRSSVESVAKNHG